MATSGTFTGSRGGGSTGPWLTLKWSRIQTDIANNRSLIRLELRLHADYYMNFSASKSGSLDGLSFTHTTGFSGTGSKLLKTRDMWINHNSDGTKSEYISASFNINISWGSSNISSLSVGGTANITAIPRASDFTSFAFTDQYLAENQANSVSYTLGRKSSSFSHLMTLRAGGITIKTWTDTGTGSRTWALTASEVNSIIRRAPNATGITVSLTMQTKSGSSNIGSSKTLSDWVSFESSLKPSASGLSFSIYGSGRDKTIGKYVQGISRVTASFSSSPGYGATTASRKIIIRRASDDKNSQTISGNSGTTPNPVALSGTYEIIGTITDSRGRTDSVSTTFTVYAYSSPKISNFSTRRGSPSTNVIAPLAVSWSTLSGSNHADITIVRTNSAGTNSTLYSINDSTAGSVSTTRTFTSQSDAESFVYTLTVTDSFGKKTTSTSFVGTAFQELTIARGQGVGIGKVHERGAIDVEGDGYFLGKIRIGDYDVINEETRDGTRGLELGDGLYIRNGYLDVNSYNEGTYGIGRMQAYYDADDSEFRMYGRDGSYNAHGIELSLPYNGSIKQSPWVWINNYENGWENYSPTSGGFIRGYYRKTSHGTVQIMGFVKNGSGKIFTLGSGYRPSDTFVFNQRSNETHGARVDISYSGTVTCQTSGVSWLSLCGIEFPAR